MADGTCSVSTCSVAAFSRGWCRTHYNRWHNTGDVQAHIPVRHRASYSQGQTRKLADCDEPVRSRGLCAAHYSRTLKTGDVREGERIRRKGRACSVPGCPNPSRTRTWCHGHYRRYRLTGDVQPDVPLRPYMVEVEEHFWSKVDKNGPLPEHRPELGPCWLWTGAPNGSGYGTFVGGGTREGAHRVSLRLAGVEIPDGHEPDHLCRVTLCVRPSHLDPVTHTENIRRGENVTKPVCVNGHPREGIGRCKRCAAESQRAIRVKLRPSEDGRRIPLKVTPEVLAEVAAVYRAALEISEPPLYAVARRFDRSYGTANTLAKRARAAGLLGRHESGVGNYAHRTRRRQSS